jgi:hypothetical protein
MPDSEADAAFLAGAALGRLDAIVRANPPWSGVFRRRLALAAATAGVSSNGRSDDEAVLRDAFHLTRPGADPGPAGRHGLAWRALTANSAGQWRSAMRLAAEHLQVRNEEVLREAFDGAESCIAGSGSAPFAAARAREGALSVATSAERRGAEAEILAAALADCVLAQKLNWPFVLPLLAEPLLSRATRRAAGTAGSETTRVLLGYARAAERACDLAAELERRSEGLVEALPKLRAKGAGAALAALLDEDSLSVASKISGLSERGARRLFDRLEGLGVIRELTGRATFRFYGL